MSHPPIHVVGAGAVGTVLAAYLAEARHPARLIVRPRDLDRMAQAQALCVDRVAGRGMLQLPKPEITANYRLAEGDIVLLCVKHRDLEDVMAQIEAAGQTRLTLVPCLNGVGAAATLRRRFPEAEVVPLTVMFNAQLLEALHARMTTKPQILLNTRDKSLLALFRDSDLQVQQAEDESVAWGKLLINLANGLAALTHTTFKDLLTNPDMKRCFVLTLDEATTVLDRAGVAYTLPVPLSYRAYRAVLTHGGPLPWWFARLRNGLSESSYPSMVADVESGKETEVAQLNGEIVTLAQENQLPAPINALIVDMVQALHGQPQDYFLSPAALRSRLEAA